jgi:hypothetical protein
MGEQIGKHCKSYGDDSKPMGKEETVLAVDSKTRDADGQDR